MGGRIWARRREERGSEFGFWLPQFVANVDDPELPQIPVGVAASLDTHL